MECYDLSRSWLAWFMASIKNIFEILIGEMNGNNTWAGTVALC